MSITFIMAMRLEHLERMAGIPLPASVQWEQVLETGSPFWPVLDALETHAAQGQVLYNDDTGMKVLELMKQRDESDAAETGKPQRPTRSAAATSRAVPALDVRRRGSVLQPPVAALPARLGG